MDILHLNKDVTLNIFLYLHKDNLDYLMLVNKLFHSYISSDIFKKIYSEIKHPITFNLVDNFCLRCNEDIIFLLDDIDKNMYRCRHLFV